MENNIKAIHDTTKGIWIVGEPGSGKSYKVRMEEPSLFLKSISKWWDGYTN
jgi:predicted PilT family ATPase